jgi:hypothetical protein
MIMQRDAMTHDERSARRTAARLACLAVLPLFWGAAASAQMFQETDQLEAPINAVQLIYLPEHGTLVLKNSASAVAVVRIADGSSSTHLATTAFLDMSASQDGDYVYVADYGGENIGYGTPRTPSYVHRLTVESGSWEVKGAYIAGRVEATTADRFLLMSLDQWVSITLNEWGAGADVVELTGTSWSVYSGDIQYDPAAGRIIHGNSGLSSQEVQAFRINGTSIVIQESSGGYGSASGHGGSTVLATDGSAFYYGRLSVDALDVSSNRLVFTETIYAATGDIAFGNGRYFDAWTGEELGELPFGTTTYGLNRNGCDFWAYDASANMLRHYMPTVGARCDDPELPPSDGGTPSDAGASSDAGHTADAATERDASSDPADAGAAVDSGRGSMQQDDAGVACGDASLADASFADAALDGTTDAAPDEDEAPPASGPDAAVPTCLDAGTTSLTDAARSDAGAVESGDSVPFPEGGCSAVAARPSDPSLAGTGALFVLASCLVHRLRRRR